MSEVHKSGAAELEVDQEVLLKALDRVTDGVSTSFIERATAVLESIREPAQMQWPRRTGKTAESLTVRPFVRPNSLAVQIAARGPQVFYQRWSVRLEADLDREAEHAGRRGLTAESRKALRNNWRRMLTRRHGRGAPNERLAGRGVWSVLVRSPANKATRELVPELQADLAKLAGG